MDEHAEIKLTDEQLAEAKALARYLATDGQLGRCPGWYSKAVICQVVGVPLWQYDQIPLKYKQQAAQMLRAEAVAGETRRRMLRHAAPQSKVENIGPEIDLPADKVDIQVRGSFTRPQLHNPEFAAEAIHGWPEKDHCAVYANVTTAGPEQPFAYTVIDFRPVCGPLSPAAEARRTFVRESGQYEPRAHLIEFNDPGEKVVMLRCGMDYHVQSEALRLNCTITVPASDRANLLELIEAAAPPPDQGAGEP